jgi:type IV pilus assembly protein PilE
VASRRAANVFIISRRICSQMKPHSGFTLIEVMIVIVIVSILTAIAVPAYSDYVTRGRLAEAYAMLGGQRVRMEQYYQDQRSYTGACSAGTVAPPMAATSYFNYSCNIAADGQSYTLVADGQSSLAGFRFTVDQNNGRATPGVPSGWTASASCWIRSKDGSC